MLQEQYALGFGLFAVASVSDVIDGAIARQYKSQASRLGSVLDPLADKCLVASLSISLTIGGLIPGAHWPPHIHPHTHTQHQHTHHLHIIAVLTSCADHSHSGKRPRTHCRELLPQIHHPASSCKSHGHMTGIMAALFSPPPQRTWARYWDIQRSTVQVTPSLLGKVRSARTVCLT